MGVGGSKASSSGRSRRSSAPLTWRQRWKAFNKVSVDHPPRRNFMGGGHASNGGGHGTKLHIFDFKGGGGGSRRRRQKEAWGGVRDRRLSSTRVAPEVSTHHHLPLSHLHNSPCEDILISGESRQTFSSLRTGCTFLHRSSTFLMGNSKNKPFSAESSTITTAPSSATSVGLVHLGRLRSVDFRLGSVILRSATSTSQNSHHSSRTSLTSSPTTSQSLLFLDALTSPTSFILTRSSSRPHKGWGGFTGSIRFDGGLYSISQDGPFPPPSKPSLPFRKRRRLSSSVGDDPPLDIFDSSSTQQVIGLLLKKSETPASPSSSTSSVTKSGDVEAADVFTIGGLVGSACLRPGRDWSDFLEVRNVEGSLLFTAQRFNRMSGGFEFQVYSSLGGSDDQEDAGDEAQSSAGAMIAATLVRLEESKFILRVYVPCPAVVKGLLLGLATLLMYLLAR